MAYLPSGEKYMLYGSSTAIDLPALPVSGSIGVKLPSVRPSALFATHSVFRSHAGTTCCGLTPTLNVSTTFSVAGSMTDTLLSTRFGTYTRSSAPLTFGLKRLAATSLYRLVGSRTSGMPGTVTTARGAAAGDDAPLVGAEPCAIGVAGKPSDAPSRTTSVEARFRFIISQFSVICAASTVTRCNRLANRRDAVADDFLGAELAELRSRGPRIAGHTDARSALGRCRELPRVDLRRVDGQHQRSIGGAGVSPDLCRAQALRTQGVGIRLVGGGVVLGDEMRARRRMRPGAIEPRSDCRQLRLIAAVIADQHDVGEAVLREAARARVEQALEGLVRNADRAGEAHVRARWRDAAL